MSVEKPESLQLPRRRVLTLFAVALAVASAITVCFVLPAEFRLDPTGIGAATGLLKLAGPKIVSATEVSKEPLAGVPASAAGRYYDKLPYRSDAVEIPLSSDSEPSAELEYKVRMKAGSTLVYSWTVEGGKDPEAFYFDFHGEGGGSVSAGESRVIEFRQATGIKSAGMLVAPIEGIFGWYLQNQSENPVVVHLQVSGFYELIPPGQYGNEAGIVATAMSRK